MGSGNYISIIPPLFTLHIPLLSLLTFSSFSFHTNPFLQEKTLKSLQMNQFTLNLQPSDTLWYTPTTMEQQQQQQQPLKTYQLFYNNNNNNSYSDIESDNNSTTSANIDTTTTTLDKEHMFEKPLTPSDVGKLNRLVIPKQHAEKYLPLASTTSTTAATTVDGASGGGLLLSFEDETGKNWRFRYSYWNSSQSYVLTKGWSRYVKEKKLDAGDVVLFERHRFEHDRFFIGWRRRGTSNPVQGTNSPGWNGRSSYNFNVSNYGGYNGNFGHNVVHSQQSYVLPQQISAFSNFRPESFPDQGRVQVRQKSKKSGSGNSKRVRLFGVNLECQLEDEDQVIEDESQTSDGSSLSSQGHGFGSGSTMGPTAYNNFGYVNYPPNHHNNHMGVGDYNINIG